MIAYLAVSRPGSHSALDGARHLEPPKERRPHLGTLLHHVQAVVCNVPETRCGDEYIAGRITFIAQRLSEIKATRPTNVASLHLMSTTRSPIHVTCRNQASVHCDAKETEPSPSAFRSWPPRRRFLHQVEYTRVRGSRGSIDEGVVSGCEARIMWAQARARWRGYLCTYLVHGRGLEVDGHDSEYGGWQGRTNLAKATTATVKAAHRSN